jgi:hypothetical protein
MVSHPKVFEIIKYPQLVPQGQRQMGNPNMVVVSKHNMCFPGIFPNENRAGEGAG